MKYLLLTFLFFFCFSDHIQGQSCLPGETHFFTQGQIDSFSINYPGCTKIEGRVLIGEESGNDDITNLEGLSTLTIVGEGLVLYGLRNVINLKGLENLDSVGGYLGIYDTELSSIVQLQNLKYIGGSLDLKSNHSLESLSGLENIKSLGGSLRTYEGSANFSGLKNLESIDGDLTIRYTGSDFGGLESLKFITGRIFFQNSFVQDLCCLENLESIAGLELEYTHLSNISGLSNLDSIFGDVILSN